MPANHCQIFTDFPDKIVSDLIRKICKIRKRKNIFVTQFSRFGYSGAKLYLIYLERRPLGIPYLIKIAKYDDIEKEHLAIDQLKDHILDCRLEVHDIIETKTKDFAALMYTHKGDPKDAQNPKTLREVLCSKGKELSVKDITLILKDLYANKLEVAHSRAKLKKIHTNTHYKAYFRKHVSQKSIIKILGRQADNERIKFMDSEFYNPLRMLKELPSNIMQMVGKVHGDFHPDNVILDRSLKPTIIDFAWANKNRDILLDFVLMENSIRFMHFPRPVNLYNQRAFDNLLLEETGWQRVDEIDFGNKEARNLYKRIADIIGEIRSYAKSALGEHFLMDRYLFTQFIVLYGLIRYESYDQYNGLRMLGMLSQKLKDQGPLSISV
jgi:hypothetical protein